jgi:hypothetical protein
MKELDYKYIERRILACAPGTVLDLGEDKHNSLILAGFYGHAGFRRTEYSPYSGQRPFWMVSGCTHRGAETHLKNRMWIGNLSNEVWTEELVVEYLATGKLPDAVQNGGSIFGNIRAKLPQSLVNK